MTTGYKFGHSQITGHPGVDWSRAASYLVGLHKRSVHSVDLVDISDIEANLAFKDRLLEARSIDGLSDEDKALAEELASADGVDISHLPGGENYRVSVVSSSNPLGLPGNFWALVTDASEGALVAALMRTVETEGGAELEFKGPDGEDWLPLADLSVIQDYNIVGVLPNAEKLYKNLDRDNTLGVISDYHLDPDGPLPTMDQLEVLRPKDMPEPRGADDPYWERTGESYEEYANRYNVFDLPGGDAPTEEEAEEVTEEVTEDVEDVEEDSVPEAEEDSEEEPLTAALTLDSARDLPDAIAAALLNSDLRWYVERRVAALGLDADLPWQKN
jgi:hypothetical protein